MDRTGIGTGCWARFRVQCRAERSPCHICGDPIDYGLQHGDPMAWELDHDLPVVARPDLELEPAFFRASHSRCNRWRGASGGLEALGVVVDEDDLGEPSEVW